VLPALLAALFTLAAGGCKSRLLRATVERKIAHRLGDKLGPAEKYQVRILGTYDNDLVRGRAKLIRITGRQVFARREIMLAAVRLEIRDLRYEGEKPYFVSVRDNEIEVELTDRDLNAYLAARRTRYQPRVTFLQDVGALKMTYRFLGKDVPISARGHLEVEAGERLMFRADTVNLKLLDAPGFNERFVEDRINPLLDLSKLDLPLKLESARMEPGRVIIHGSAILGGETPR